MTSIESARSSAYSEDIRWRMVWQTEALGRVTKRSYPKEKAHRKLTTPAQLLILHLVCQTPGILLHEIQTS